MRHLPGFVLLTFVSVWLSESPRAASQIYWALTSGDFGPPSGALNRANLDGSGIQNLVSSNEAAFSSVAVDLAGGRVYWTDRFNHTIQRANLDGSDVETLISGANFPDGIAVDPGSGFIYWNADEGIGRAGLDGSNAQILIPLSGVAGLASGLALDAANGKLYWVQGQQIRRANVDGSTIQTIYVGVAVDDVALDGCGKVYWGENFPQGRLRRANLDGTAPETLLERPASVRSVAADGSAGKVYFGWGQGLTAPGSEESPRIERANLDGSGAEVLIPLDFTFPPTGLALDAEQGEGGMCVPASSTVGLMALVAGLGLGGALVLRRRTRSV